MATQNIGTNSIAVVGQELEGMMHGTTLNQVTDLYGVYNRAARRIMADVDPQETKVLASFGKVYNGVFDYALFTDLKGNKIIDFAPPANRTLLDNYDQSYNKAFDLYKNYTIKPSFTPFYNSATRTIRLAASNLVSGIQVNAADNVTDNGTWVAGGSAGTAANNQLFYTNGVAGSVQTNLASGVNPSTGYLENSTFTAVNLTDNYNNNADNFFYIYLPDASAFISIDFRLGSSSANYYHQDTITTDALGNAFVTGWNLIKVPFTSMTAVGSPAISSIGYIRITFHYNGTQENQVLINQVYSRIGVIFDMEYYSKYLFRNSTTGAFQETVLTDNDIVNLDTDAYNLFLFASGVEAVQQMQGLDALFFDATQFEKSYTRELTAYKSKYKSETQKPQSAYYYKPRTSYQRFMGSGWTGPPG